MTIVYLLIFIFFFSEQSCGKVFQPFLCSPIQLEEKLKFATQDKVNYLLSYADFLVERGEYATAQRYYSRAIILGADINRTLAAIALVNVKSHKFNKAYETYKQLLEKFPASPYAYEGLHQLAYTSKSVKDKEKVLRLIVESYPEASEAAYLLGEIYYKDGRFKEAIDVFEKVSTTSAYYKGAIAKMSFAYSQLGAYSKAHQLAQTLSPATDTYLWLGFLSYKLGDYSKSVEFFKKVKNEYGYFNLGCVGLVVGSYTESIKYFSQAASYPIDEQFKEQVLYGKFLAYLYNNAIAEALHLISNFGSYYRQQAYFALANRYFNAHMFKQAAFYYRMLLFNEKELPQSIRECSLLNLAISMCLIGEHKEADQLFERFHKHFPKSEWREWAWHWWACNDYLRNLYPKAIAKFEILFDSSDRTLAGYSIYNAAASYFNLKNYHKSIELYAKLQKQYPESEICMKAEYMSALSLYKLNKFEEAIFAFSKLAGKSFEYAEHANYFVGLSYFKLAKFSKAADIFKQLTATKNKQLRSQSLSFLGNCYYNQGNYKQAIKIYQQLLGEDTPDKLRAEAYYRLGDCYLMMENLEGAILHFRKSANVGDFFVSDLSRLRIAQLYKQQGNVDQAIKEYQNAAAYLPRTLIDECYWGLGESFMEVGQFDNAIDQFLKISKDSGYYHDAQLNIGLCYFCQKNYKQAKYYFEKVVKLSKERPDLSSKAEYYLGLCQQ